MNAAFSNKIKIKFWGVRGSIPTPGPQTIKYGGNTSCVELLFPGNELFILDAGTGIRELGSYLIKYNGQEKINLFISHFHWDHIQGLPFFAPLRNKNLQMNIFGCEEPDNHIQKILSAQMESTYFPIELTDLAASIKFISLQQGKYLLGNIELETQYINHPGYALGYKFTYDGRSIVFISDNEPFTNEMPQSGNKAISGQYAKSPDKLETDIEKIFDNFSEHKTGKLIDFIADCDLLIHDAQYTPDEYLEKKQWGHSPYTYPIELGNAANVKKLVLYHHDPAHSDADMDKIKISAREYGSQFKNNMEIFVAREGDEYYI